MSRDDRLAMIRRSEAERLQGGDVIYGIWRQGRAVGAAGAHRRVAADGLEIGYWLRADEQGRGTMTEVVRALSRTILEIPGITHVEIRHDEANTRSAAIARRCGYRMVCRERRPITAPAESGWGLLWRLGGNPAQEV
jgi:RimJ/RimL family protein N-acetyltransferase